MAQPLIIPNYTRVNHMHSVEIADLNRGNGLVSIVVKYHPGDAYSQNTNIEARYDPKDDRFVVCGVHLTAGRQGSSLQHFHERLLDADMVLQDPVLLEYAKRLQEKP